MSRSMSRAEREDFLAQPRVAIVNIAEAGRGPLAEILAFIRDALQLTDR